MKKTLFGISILVLASTAAIASVATTASPLSSSQATNPFTTDSSDKQVGAGFEERTSFLNGYVFFNQLVDKKFFYELRGCYIHNLIINAQTTPLPAITQQDNLDGVGAVGIFGYNVPVNSAVTVMPFVRLQYLTNTLVAYKDSSGNEVSSDGVTSYLGLKLIMKVNDVLSTYAQYNAGYQVSELYGKGVFVTTNRPKVYALTSIIEIGFPYKINKSWLFTPYFQWITTGNNPNSAAFNALAPMKQTGTTGATALYALRLAYIL